jgi:DNA-binding GntR family transcriptional regulator
MKSLSERAEKAGLDTLLVTKEGGLIYTDFSTFWPNRQKIRIHAYKTDDCRHTQGAFPYSRKKLTNVGGSSRKIFSQLGKIWHAIEKRDPEAARLATIEHIDYIEKTLRLALSQK